MNPPAAAPETPKKLQDALARAAGAGNLARVEALLAEGADPRAPDLGAFSSPIANALGAGHTKVAAALLRGGARLTNAAMTCAFGPGCRGKENSIIFCFENGLHPHAQLGNYSVPYHVVGTGNLKLIELAAKKGADFGAIGKGGVPGSHGLQEVDMPGRHFGDSLDDPGSLFVRIDRVAAWLCNHGGDLRRADNRGQTLFTKAIDSLNFPLLLALFRYGAISKAEAFAALARTVAMQQRAELTFVDEAVRRLASDRVLRAVLTCRDWEGRSLLHFAARRLGVKALAALVEGGLSPLENDACGKTAITYSRTNSEDSTALLRAAGAREAMISAAPRATVKEMRTKSRLDIK